MPGDFVSSPPETEPLPPAVIAQPGRIHDLWCRYAPERPEISTSTVFYCLAALAFLLLVLRLLVKLLGWDKPSESAKRKTR
jgi:hypothetical protein